MTKPGYKGFTLDDETIAQLDEIAKEENCRNRAEVIRRLIDYHNSIIKKIKKDIPKKFLEDVEKL